MGGCFSTLCTHNHTIHPHSIIIIYMYMYMYVIIYTCTIHVSLVVFRTLADVDKDGRLTAEEFAIAMHLLEKAKAGLTLPPTLPASLSPTSTKFNTVARSSPQTNRKVR